MIRHAPWTGKTSPAPEPGPDHSREEIGSRMERRKASGSKASLIHWPACTKTSLGPSRPPFTSEVPARWSTPPDQHPHPATSGQTPPSPSLGSSYGPRSDRRRGWVGSGVSQSLPATAGSEVSFQTRMRHMWWCGRRMMRSRAARAAFPGAPYQPPRIAAGGGGAESSRLAQTGGSTERSVDRSRTAHSDMLMHHANGRKRLAVAVAGRFPAFS